MCVCYNKNKNLIMTSFYYSKNASIDMFFTELLTPQSLECQWVKYILTKRIEENIQRYHRRYEETNNNRITLEDVLHQPNKSTRFCRQNIVTMDIILNTPQIKWSSSDYYMLASNPNITWEDICNNPNIKWNYTALSHNPNITWDIICENPDKPWNYTDMLNYNINITADIVIRNPDKFKYFEWLQSFIDFHQIHSYFTPYTFDYFICIKYPLLFSRSSLKEDLMKTFWHPSNMEKWKNYGFDDDDSEFI